MRKKILFGIVLMTISISAHAEWLEDIFNALLASQGLQLGMLDKQGEMLGVQKNIFSSQKEIEKLMKQVNGDLTSHSGWGNYQSRDYQSYGGSARDWSGVMQMAEAGRGAGALGESMGGIANQFPSDPSTYNRGVADKRNQQYYALKSQTVLAARAASELDYNKIQDQIAYQRMLQEQIEKTNDLKAAVDLSSRIQVEGNLITLEILRQSALANQQQAIAEQSTVNAALSNAKFLSK